MSEQNKAHVRCAIEEIWSSSRFIADLVLVRTRSDALLRAELLALRHQLRVLERTVGGFESRRRIVQRGRSVAAAASSREVLQILRSG